MPDYLHDASKKIERSLRRQGPAPPYVEPAVGQCGRVSREPDQFLVGGGANASTPLGPFGFTMTETRVWETGRDYLLTPSPRIVLAPGGPITEHESPRRVRRLTVVSPQPTA
jgi:hypothetical protein